MPSGKPVRDIQYDLNKFILSPLGTNSSNDIEDECFLTCFRLSRFRSDVMRLAIEKYPKEYALKMKSLGPKCKLYFQKQWNISSWFELANTGDLVRNITEQMEAKGRVKNNVLTLRVAFGKAKIGDYFESEEEMNEYLDDEDGNALEFSQVEMPSSPFARRAGGIMREKNHSNRTSAEELILQLYQTESCKLYHGFLRQHMTSFHRIVTAHIATHKDHSVFKKAINENTIPTDEELDIHLLGVYIQRGHKNDISGGVLPETNSYPPTNAMIITPPEHCDWKKKNNSNTVLNEMRFRDAQFPSLANLQSMQVSTLPSKLIGLTFKSFYGEDETSAIISRSLTLESSMHDVMDKYDICKDLDISDVENSKFLIKKKNGSFFTLRYDYFISMTVNKIISISNIDEDYLIVIKNKMRE